VTYPKQQKGQAERESWRIPAPPLPA